jgi:predicted  nucleic acid-binding Zn-ribbon protein
MTEKKDFLEKQKEQIAEWNKMIEELMQTAKKTQVEASVKFENYIEDLKERLEDMRLKMEDVKKSGDTGWHDLRTGMENAWKDLANAFEKARSRFK